MFNSMTGLSDALMFVAFITGGAIGWVYFDVIVDKIKKVVHKKSE